MESEAAAPVAIVDSVPIYRRGLASVCETAGHTIEVAGLSDLPSGALGAVVVVLRSEADWRLLADASARRRDCPFVAVIHSLATPVVERALSTGATGVLGMSATLDEVTEVVHAALEGRTLLPAHVAQEIADETAEAHPLSATDLEWLRGLAQGLTVAQLAARVGYSQRQMHRRLRRMYSRLGVRGRAEALHYAEQIGLLGDFEDGEEQKAQG